MWVGLFVLVPALLVLDGWHMYKETYPHKKHRCSTCSTGVADASVALVLDRCR